MIKPACKRRSPLLQAHFWIITASFSILLIFHYPGVLRLPRQLNFQFLLGLERHAIERIFFLFPITYAAYIYGLGGGIICLVLSLVVMLPRVFLISTYPRDALFESCLTLAFGILSNLWLESRRRQLNWREEALVKLEVTKQEIQRVGKRFVEIFEKAHDAIWIQTRTGRISAANLSAAKLTGYNLSELIGAEVARLFGQEGLVLAGEVEQRLLAGSEVTQPYEQKIRKKDNSEAIFMLTTSLLSAEEQPALLHIARDITEERKMQASLRLYADQVSNAYEEERMRIARELHDDTIQIMVAISRQLDNFITRNRGLKREQLQPLEKIRENIDDALVRIRRFIQDLRPPTLEYLGLVPALRELVSQVQQDTGLRVDFRVEGNVRLPAKEQELLVYRIVQEALRNVWKHAQAGVVELNLNAAGSKTIVTIRDNGRGFIPVKDNRFLEMGKLGLMGMRERAYLLGGRLEIHSIPGEGTEVRLEFGG